MGARNILRLLTEALTSGDKISLGSSETVVFKPEVDDQGAFNFGDGALDFDVKVFLGATTDFALFDVGNGQLTLDSAELNLGDDDELEFGDATDGDVRVRWDNTDLDWLAAADDTVMKFGTGTNSFDIWVYGNIPTSYLLWDASADVIELRGPVRPKGFNSLGRRFELSTQYNDQGVPQLNSGIDTTLATNILSNKDFEILGTNAVNTSSIRGVEGGIVLLTAGADADQVILLPHLDAGITAWTGTTWGTDRETEWEAHIATNAAIATQITWAGLKLTNTPVATTDANSIFFRYEDDVASGVWQVVEAIANSDTITNTSVTVAVSTQYHLKIVIASDRTAQCYINGALVRTTAALTNAIDFIPYIGVMKDGATAAARISVFGQAISRAVAPAA